MKRYGRLIAVALLISLAPKLWAQSCPRVDFHCDQGKFPILLTFDDGPTTSTPKILDILRQERVRANFFVLGDKLVNPNGTKKAGATTLNNFKILDRIKREGHIIGSHTYHHLHHYDFATNRNLKENEIDLLKKSKISWWKSFELIKTSSALNKYLDNDGEIFFRLPYGQGWFEAERKTHRDSKVLEELLRSEDRNNTPVHVGWNIDTEDWKTTSPHNFLLQIKEQICQKGGGIVLMHDHTQLTQANLQCLIRGLKSGGHHFVSSPHQIDQEQTPKLVMNYRDIKGIHQPPEKRCRDDESANSIDRAEDQLDALIKHLNKQSEYTPFANRVHNQNIYSLRNDNGKLKYEHLITFSKYKSIGKLAQSKELADWANENAHNLGALHFFTGDSGIQVGIDR